MSSWWKYPRLRLFDVAWNMLIVRCKVCTNIEQKEKKSWSQSNIHLKNIPRKERMYDVKVVNVQCVHAKNEMT
jgi:hypothetical protein